MLGTSTWDTSWADGAAYMVQLFDNRPPHPFFLALKITTTTLTTIAPPDWCTILLCGLVWELKLPSVGSHLVRKVLSERRKHRSLSQ